MADSLSRDDSSVGDLTAEVPSVVTGLYRGGADSVTTRRECLTESRRDRADVQVDTASVREARGT